MSQGEKRSVSTRMHRCGVKGVVGAQDVHPSNAWLPLTVGVASGRTVRVAWVAGRWAGGDLSNIWKKNCGSWNLAVGKWLCST